MEDIESEAQTMISHGQAKLAELEEKRRVSGFLCLAQTTRSTVLTPSVTGT
jgi:hypothetical protein